jgi:hypothetical protein
MKFKVGDKVKVLDSYPGSSVAHSGTIGTVVDNEGSYFELAFPVKVVFKNGSEEIFKEKELELIDEI